MQCDRPEPVALNAAEISACLQHPEFAPHIEASVDSTNSSLAQRRARGESVRVLLAEQQTAGRGRQGRKWLSPPRRGLYLSMAWEFQRAARDLSPLALIAGLAAADAIAATSSVRVGLKWPNDLQVKGRKLGGCLIDLSPLGRYGCLAILGIGINVSLAGETGPDQPWTDLRSEGGSSDRNMLAAELINTLVRDLSLFQDSGFEPFRPRWEACDVLQGQRVSVGTQSTGLQGQVCGVDAAGALVLQTAAGKRCVHAGEVSVRPLNSAE